MTTEQENAAPKADMSGELVELAAEIVAAYVGNNAVPSNELPSLIKDVYGALAEAVQNTTEPAESEPEVAARPAVPIRRSVTDDYLVCLDCGGQFKSLRRHLKSRHNLTPEEYRAKWNLPLDYPMVAKNYHEARSQMAKTMGLGRKAKEG